jgi:oxalate decarboxylase
LNWAVYNGTKAFLNSFSFALREELKDTKVTVTCLMPGATETSFADSHMWIEEGGPRPETRSLSEDRKNGAGPVPNTFSYRLLQQEPRRMTGGTVRIVDSTNFLASKTIAATLVELEPGAMRELHWHPNADEWQYYIEGEGRITVFGSESKARTFDYRAGDVGHVPFAMGPYIENTGPGPLRFLEMFRSDRYADLSLNQWLALTPRVLVESHLGIGADVIAALPAAKVPILPG